MAKKKKTSAAQEAKGAVAGLKGDLPLRPVVPLPSPSSTVVPAPTTSKTSKAKTAVQTPSSPSALVICRNKHWRYISSFHGPWLQLPPEILETLAFTNYTTPRPHPFDPSVLFDLVQIRRFVDDATNLAVSAASGVPCATLSGAAGFGLAGGGVGGGGGGIGGGGIGGGIAGGIGGGWGGGSGAGRLSWERRHRMREQATHKLARAYQLDEIASSVATMQSASALDTLAAQVLQRSAADPDAKYVHFFHEKIPSRRVAESTSLRALDEVVASRPAAGEPLRTRAAVRVFKHDLEGAARDLTDALRLHRLYSPQHQQQQQAASSGGMDGPHLGPGRRRGDVVLRVEEPPGSLEMQLLFQRAGVYLALACQHAKSLLSYRTSVAVGAAGQRGEGSDVNATATNHGDGAVPSPAEHGDAASENNNNSNKPDPGLSLGPEQQATAPAAVAQARKWVRTHAKRALRDYLSFLSHLEYSPDFPTHLAEQFIETLKRLATRARSSGSYPPPSRPDGPVSPLPVTHRTFAVSDLFAANPPSDLPPYPKTDVVSSATVTTTTNGPRQSAARPAAAEILTYHPLLTDALHSVLLCHCLLHTSPAELLRHARMVARLTRLADGYPVFQGSRPPARADWIAVLRALPHRDHQRLLLRQGEGNDAGKNDDDDVGDSDTWTSQFVAAWEEALGVQPPLPLFRGGPQPKTEGDGSGGPEHPVGTERATVVARWLLEVPPPEDGAGRRRKKKVVSGVSALAFGGGGGGGGGGGSGDPCDGKTKGAGAGPGDSVPGPQEEGEWVGNCRPEGVQNRFQLPVI